MRSGEEGDTEISYRLPVLIHWIAIVEARQFPPTPVDESTGDQ